MPEDTNLPKEVNEKPAAAKPKAEPQAKQAGMRITCSPKVVGHLHDPERNIMIPAHGQNPVEISGEVKEGSWLDCQIKANLITVK